MRLLRSAAPGAVSQDNRAFVSRHELVTRHRGHRVQHEAALNIPTWSGELLDHSLAGCGKIRERRLLRITDGQKHRLEEAQQKQ